MRTTRSAFTLFEMLLVVAIIGLLAALIAPTLGKQFGRSQVGITKAQLQDLSTKVEQFRLHVGRYPTEEEGLAALVEKPQGVDSWDGPYLGKASVPKDPWNNEFVYELDDEWGFRLISLGADGREGGEGEAADLDNRS